MGLPMRNFACIAIFFSCVVIASFTSNAADTTREFGIDRSNLTREQEAEQEKTLRGIRALHATWFRDVLSATPKFVNELRLAKENHLKMLVNVLQSKADYDDGYENPNAGEDFRKRCGWPQGSGQISQMKLDKFKQRLSSELDAVKDADLNIDAFEIGNEVDWICFNGDVPNGHAATDEEWMVAVRGYARFLKAAAEVIHDSRYFPEAKIITFGIAHSSDRWDRPPHHFSNPARMVAMLRNLDGFNYLDNSEYHVDGYGTHVYPDANNLEQSVGDLIREDAAILGPDKPFWITEWGLDAKKYPNKQGQTRGQGIEDFYRTLRKLRMPFGPAFYYCYAPGGKALVDAKGDLLPESRTLAAAAEQH